MKLTRARRLWWAVIALNAATLGRGSEAKAAWRVVERWPLWRWLAWAIPVGVAVVVWVVGRLWK